MKLHYLFVFYQILKITYAAESCYATNEDPYRRVGQKSSYFISENLDDSLIEVEGCEPKMLWYLGRHGARRPSSGEIEDYGSRMPALQEKIVSAGILGEGEMCEEDYINIGGYTWHLTPDDHKLLMESGRDEQRGLGSRWINRLPTILDDPELIQTRATYWQRTYGSAEAFLEGAYPGQNVTFPHIMDTDMLLRFWDFCPAYLYGVDHNNRTFVEEYKFFASPAWQEMIADVSRRVGVEVTHEDVWMAWALCRYDLAEFPNVHEHISPWCAIFSDENMKMFDFNDDLVFYQLGGYGHDINWKMTKPLVEEMKMRFIDMSSGSNEKKAYLYFTHSEAVNTMLPVFGLYRDPEPLTADMWPSDSHLWQTSKMLAFSHNIALVGLECPEREERFNIQVYHQEKPIEVPFCGDSICSYSQFMELIQPVLDVDFHFECNHDVLYPDEIRKHYYQ